MHNYKPRQTLRIVTLQLAIPASTDIDEVADGISEMLTNAMCGENYLVSDWQYAQLLDETPIVILSDDPDEGEAFGAILNGLQACEVALQLAMRRMKDWWPWCRKRSDK
jgi:hypothetical protein